jgi:hypothetical protein
VYVQTVRRPLEIFNLSSSVNIRFCKQTIGVGGFSREALTITSQKLSDIPIFFKASCPEKETGSNVNTLMALKKTVPKEDPV